MQHSQQFLLRLADRGDMAHFELRHDDRERPFHICFRPKAGCFVVNAMQDGIWGKEERHGLKPGVRPVTPALVHRERERVAVFVGEQAVVWTTAPERRRAQWPSPTASGVLYNVVAPRMQAEVHWPDDGGPPRLCAFPLPGGRRLALHDQVPAGLSVQLLDDIVTHAQPLLRSVAACPAVSAIVSARAPGLALMLASLMPHLPLWLLGEAPEEFAKLADIARHGGTGTVHADTDAASLPPRGLVVGRGLAATPWPDASCQHDIDTPDAAPRVARRPAAGAARAGSAVAGSVRSHPLRPGLDLVVALHNGEDHIADCLASLLDPGREDMRVLVVDDGSTDASAGIVSRLFGQTPQLQLLRKPNGGCASARNYGRLMSDRTHIAFVDADDMADPGFFGALHDLARSKAADLVIGSFDLFDPSASPPRRQHDGDRALIAECPSEPFGEERAISLPPARLLRSQPSVWRAVFRREFLDAHAIWFPESIRAYDDFLFHIRCLLHLSEVWMLPARRYLYRQHPHQDIRRRDARHFGNLAMASMLLRDVPPVPAGTVREFRQAIVEVINWSAERLSPELQGTFLQAAAELCATLSKLPVAGKIMPAPQIELALEKVRHPDFRPLFERALAQVAACPAGHAWAWAVPTVDHPGFVLQRAAQRRSL